MRNATATVAIGAMCLLIAGCSFERRAERPRLSIKDSPPGIVTGSIPPAAKPAAVKKETDVEEVARAEQLKRCQQRHVDYQAGKLNESAEQKRTLDDICAELHRADHAQKP